MGAIAYLEVLARLHGCDSERMQIARSEGGFGRACMGVLSRACRRAACARDIACRTAVLLSSKNLRLILDLSKRREHPIVISKNDRIHRSFVPPIWLA
jgi:hypothetical protein